MQVSQAFRSAATLAGLPSESLSTSALGKGRFNHETAGAVEDLYELPPMSLVLKTLRAAKCKAIEPKALFLLLTSLPSCSESGEVLSWSVGFEPHKPGRHVPESLLPYRGLLYCICNCGERRLVEIVQ